MSISNQYFSNLYDLVLCITKAVDLISPEVADHHQQVAYLAYQFAEKLHLPIEYKRRLVLSALLHDIGALSLDAKLDLIEEEPFSINNHAYIGARMLSVFPMLNNAANIIKYHHVNWNDGKGKFCKGEEVSILSHIIHISDRIAVQVNHHQNIISQINKISDNIKNKKNTVFMPELVDIFLEYFNKESLWLDLVYQPTISGIPNDLSLEAINLTLDETVGLTKIFSQIIDFRSPFTAMHSAGVAAAAEKLAELSGFSENECKMMRIAGYLHDIGKLAIPQNILEKQDKLEPLEFDIIRSHTFYTYRLLQPISGFENITQWAAYHHEKLNGNGYPFHLKADDLSLGSRIMAVADIFTAITEDRPYRKGMSFDEASVVLRRMVENGSISSFSFNLLMNNYDLIYNLRKESAEKAVEEYSKILSDNLL